MSSTWTCPCGHTFRVAESYDPKPVICPSCAAVLGETVPTRFEAPTTIQAEEPKPRTVLANPEVLVQAEEPKRHAKPVEGLSLSEPDIQLKRGCSPLACNLILVSLLGVCGLCFVGFFIQTPPFDVARDDTAFAQIKALTHVCAGYAVKHERFPDAFEKLLQKDEFGIRWMDDPNKLIDPWGRPYQYDAKGPRNKGKAPDIWCVTPNGKEIGNWPKKK